MIVTAARFTDEQDTLALTIQGSEGRDAEGNVVTPAVREVHGVTDAHRLWEPYQEWLGLGNAPDPFVPPTPRTRAEMVDDRLANDPQFSDLINVLADRFGTDRDTIVNDLKNTPRGGR